MADHHPQRQVGPQSFNRQQPRYHSGWDTRGTAALVLYEPAWVPLRLRGVQVRQWLLFYNVAVHRGLDAHALVRNFSCSHQGAGSSTIGGRLSEWRTCAVACRKPISSRTITM